MNALSGTKQIFSAALHIKLLVIIAIDVFFLCYNFLIMNEIYSHTTWWSPRPQNTHLQNYRSVIYMHTHPTTYIRGHRLKLNYLILWFRHLQLVSNRGRFTLIYSGPI